MSSNFICPVCGKENVEPKLDLNIGIPEGFQIYRCACGLGYSNYSIQGIPEDIYNYAYYDHIRYNDPLSRKKYIDHLIPYFNKSVSMAKLTPARKRLLDVGCATGDFLTWAVSNGWDADGIDISEFAVEKAKERGLNASWCSLEDLPDREGLYDVITMWDVIEHLSDMTKALEILSKKISPGGVIIIKTVSRISLVDFLARGIYKLSFNHLSGAIRRMYVPGHLFYFTPRVLKRFISKFGGVLFVAGADTPAEALVSSPLVRGGLTAMFFAQKILGITFELIVAYIPKGEQNC